MTRVAAFILLLASLSGPIRAEDASSSVRQWFEHLKQGLMSSAVESSYQQGRGVSNVAAVRGAQQGAEDRAKPYFKGSSRDKKATQLKKEKAELASAVDLVLAGKNPEALKALDEFEAKHPKSPLLADVKQAREKLR